MTERRHYQKTIGSISLEVSREGYLGHDYGYGAKITIPTGWNDACPIVTNNLSVEELRDLRYLIDRALAEDFR